MSSGAGSGRGLPDPHWSEAVTAFVAARDGRRVDQDGLLKHCRERLAASKVVHVVEELPVDAQGKILKRLLRAGQSTDRGQE
jgi:acyl-coenzyme A synthetase/AMP-(fatty) acid ligase